MDNNLSIKTKGSIFIIVFLFSSALFAQLPITSISPQGERGSCYIAVFEVQHSATPSYSYDSNITVIGQPTIEWRRYSESTSSMYTYHRGRMTIPLDIPAGMYKVRLVNSGFPGTCHCAEGWMTINEFSEEVSSASPNIVNAGDSNVTLTMTYEPALKNWSNYVILAVTSDNPAISYVPGSGAFLSATQLKLTINIAADSTLGPFTLYIKYGPPVYLNKKSAGVSGGSTIQVTPNVAGDFATIRLNSTSNIITIEQANPRISMVTPDIVSLGENNVQLSITGVNFAQGITLTTTFPGVTFSRTQFISESQMISYVTVSPTASIGWVPMKVTNPDGRTSTNGQVFRVATKRPKIISVSNPVLLIGRSSQQVCISGENFYSGATVIFYSEFVHGREVRVLNENTICLLIDVDENAAPGMIGIAVFNPDGTNDRAMNIFMLSNDSFTDRTIQLLYPGVQGGIPSYVNEEKLTPLELIDTEYPVFRWYSLAWRFKISIYKPLDGQASFSEVVRNRPYYETIVDGVNYFQYPLQARRLEPGVRYFWKVTAYFGTVPASYYNTSVQNSVDDTSFQGEMKESEIWSFVVRENATEEREVFRYGTLNSIDTIAIEPAYVEVVPGDRLILELRGYDKNQNIAAFVPDNFMINLGDLERNYPDVKLLPKSFGRAELIVPNLKGNDDFRSRLLRNPEEFGRLPILIYISKNAKGVGAVLAMWQNKRYYGFVNVLPPKKTMLENGEIDRFRIGVSERLSEAFEVQLDTPAQAGSVVSGTGRLFIDAAGFRETGYFPVKVDDVRLDSSGRAYTGTVQFSGAQPSALAGFGLIVENIGISCSKPAEINGKILLPSKSGTEKITFSGGLLATGDITANAQVEAMIRLDQAEIPAESLIKIDFDSSDSPEPKKFDPEFRGLIIPAVINNEPQKLFAVTGPDQLAGINGVKSPKTDFAKLDLTNIKKMPSVKPAEGIYLTAVRTDNDAVRLTWHATDDSIKTFNIYRRAENENQYRLVGERICSDLFTDDYVYSDTSYWYKLAGLNDQSIEIKISKPIKIK